MHHFNEDDQRYMKARIDIIQAIKSIQDLNDYQKEHLFRELFGAEAWYQVLRIMESYRQGGK